MDKYDYYTINIKPLLGYAVYGWSRFPKGSVLAGQPMKVYVCRFDSLEAAQARYPGANVSSKWTEPQVSLNHLPGEDDPVAGGMYPDDIGE